MVDLNIIIMKLQVQFWLILHHIKWVTVDCVV